MFPWISEIKNVDLGYIIKHHHFHAEPPDASQHVGSVTGVFFWMTSH